MQNIHQQQCENVLNGKSENLMRFLLNENVCVERINPEICYTAESKIPLMTPPAMVWFIRFPISYEELFVYRVYFKVQRKFLCGKIVIV